MRRFFYLLLFFAVTANAQQVPSRMTVAGVKLTFSDKLREELQREVNALTASPKYLKIKVDRAKVYFPIIEKVFKEEGIPDDIKYLVLQESALIADAVSVSNAVGYWQFKDFTAMEVGLRVDNEIDERMHIISSTRGAAQYLKKNNAYFNNWIFAIQAYQMGAGGALKVVDERDFGASKMDLDHNTYWYLKKFLAHKIAFESAIDGGGEITLNIYDHASNKTLQQIAKEMAVDYEQLRIYNAWLRRGHIPDDKIYPVLLPVAYNVASPLKLPVKKDEPSTIPQRVVVAEQNNFPVAGSKMAIFSKKEIQTYNGIPAIKAEKGQSLIMLAAAGDVGLSKFLNVNDIDVTHRPKVGQIYYFKSKKAKAGAHYHVVNHDETLWDVAQRYGVKVKKLMFKNRLSSENDIKPGLVLWLRHVRPRHVAAEYREIAPKEVVAEIKKEKKVEKKNKPTFQKTADPESDSLALTPDSTAVSNKKDSIISDRSGADQNINDANVEQQEPEPAAETEETVFVWHVIQPKETFYSLAKHYNVHVVEILRWNQLNISDKLSVGQEVKILQPKLLNDRKESVNLKNGLEIIHEVQAGETLYKLARKYEVTVEDLMKWNNKTDYNLSPGEKLLVKRNK